MDLIENTINDILTEDRELDRHFWKVVSECSSSEERTPELIEKFNRARMMADDMSKYVETILKVK